MLTGCAPMPGRPDAASPVAAPPPPSAGAGLPALAAQELRWLDRITWGASAADVHRLAALGEPAYRRAQLAAGARDAAAASAAASTLASPGSGAARTAADPDEDLPAVLRERIAAMPIQRASPIALAAEVEALRHAAEAAPTEAERAEARRVVQRRLEGHVRDFECRHLWRALYSPRQVQARLVWFWGNHFSVYRQKGPLRLLVADYEEQAIRPHALGRFRALLGAAIRHPAMLVYLDNAQNAAGRLNENLGRELLELHTLGVDGGYTQADVLAAARVLTGHGVLLRPGPARGAGVVRGVISADNGYRFDPARHDDGAKSLLGQPLRARGAAELDELLDRLAAHPATARHVSRKLAQHFLGLPPPPALVEALAERYLASDGRIDAVMDLLLQAPELRADPQAAEAPFKDPMQFLLSAVRASWGSDTPVTDPTPIARWLDRLGEGLYTRPTPEGHPLDPGAWTGSGQLATRFELARLIGAGAPALFRPLPAEAGPQAPRPPMAAPASAAPAVSAQMRAAWLPLLKPATRESLAQATRPATVHALWLASPDFQHR